MRKATLLLSGVFLFLVAAQAIADNLVSDIDNRTLPSTDINPSYWSGSDYNGFLNGQLKNANPSTEQAWLEALLGKDSTQSDITYIARISAGQSGLGSDVKQLSNYDPGFNWDYAVVKYGKYWIAYENTDGDRTLTTDPFRYGISHITFFDPPPTVPEPSTMLLLGSGLIGLAGLSRRLRK